MESNWRMELNCLFNMTICVCVCVYKCLQNVKWNVGQCFHWQQCDDAVGIPVTIRHHNSYNPWYTCASAIVIHSVDKKAGAILFVRIYFAAELKSSSLSSQSYLIKFHITVSWTENKKKHSSYMLVFYNCVHYSVYRYTLIRTLYTLIFFITPSQ